MDKAIVHLAGHDGRGELLDDVPRELRSALLDVRALATHRRAALTLDAQDFGTAVPLLMHARSLLSRDDAGFSCRGALMECNNELGVAWCERGEPSRALPFLRDAQMAHAFAGEEHTTGRGTAEEKTETTPPPTDAEELAHTRTLFLLAQTLGQLRKPDEAARACSWCLRRQLEKKGGDESAAPDEWAQNAAQLSGFYVSKRDWPGAWMCILAATKVIQDAAEEIAEMAAVDVVANVNIARGKFHLARLTLAKDAFKKGGAGDAEVDEDFFNPHEVSSGGEGEAETTTTTTTTTTTSGGGGGGDGDGDDKIEDAKNDDEDDAFEFPSIGLLAKDTREPETGWVPATVDGVRVVFNNAIVAFRNALTYYTLEGHVTEHVNILMDVAAAHVALAVFERGDRKRHDAIQRRRAEKLHDVVERLTNAKYDDLKLTMWHEIGEAHRAIMEQKVIADRPALSYASPARVAAMAYGKYLSAYESRYGAPSTTTTAATDAARAAKPERDGGSLAGRVPKDEEKAYLNARFFRAAVVAKSAGAGSEADALAAALEEHQKIVAYVDAFGPLPFFEEEAEVSRQFAALLPTKINHLRRLEENNIKAVDPLKKMMAGMGMS